MSPRPTSPPDIAARVRGAAAAAAGRKAANLRVLHLAAVSDFTDYFLVCSGASERQVQAISDAVEERLKGEGVRPLSIEGYNHGQWVLLDYGAFLVHVFTEVTRRFYGLERLWGDAPDVTDDFSAAE